MTTTATSCQSVKNLLTKYQRHWAELAEAQLQQERQRADIAEERIEQVEERAELAEEQVQQEHQRAQVAEQRAAALAERLRSLGIDPNTV